jgi:hypothetical protein
MKIDSTSGATILEPGYDQTPPKSWRSWLIGNPLSTADAPNQTIGKLIGLAVFASDALSSTAYASQEILIILAYAGSQALGFVFPISLAIVTLMAIVSISYEQTIHAYPAAVAPTLWRVTTWRAAGRPPRGFIDRLYPHGCRIHFFRRGADRFSFPSIVSLPC